MDSQQPQVKPFRGFRYNTQVAGDAAQLLAPPYDVIYPPMQDDLYARSDYNVVRLILNRESADDTEQSNRYTRSAESFGQWVEKGVLARDVQPAVYVYAQTYTALGETKTRVGFMARKKLEEFGGSVLAHEKTLSGPKADRLKLTRACKCNFSPIFGLYGDPGKTTDAMLASAMQNPPDIDVTLENGERNRLWAVTDPAWIAKLTGEMEDKRVMIADGHHRYETALNYMKERIEQGDATDDVKYVLMFFTNTASEGLTVLPTHRKVFNLDNFSLEDFLARIQNEFDVETVPSENGNRNATSEAELAARMKQATGPVFGLYAGKGRYSVLKQKKQAQSGVLESLDVAVLHTTLLESVLGISTQEQAEQTKLKYSPDLVAATESVDKGECQLTFILNPTPVEQMRKVSEAGLKMPQKSTYFYPKLVSGLVINPLY